MLRHKHIDKICIIITALTLALTLLFMQGEAFGLVPVSAYSYPERLFDQGRVHRIEITAKDFDEMLQNASKEEYIPADITINGEKLRNVGLRTKGNNSLHLTEKYGLQRFSFKVEFDHYEQKSYHGLDKLSLDASFQDNAYMKTYLTFDMMRKMGVKTPLCSYVWLTVNGEGYGLYLAIEEIEESFAIRNYGKDHGKLYKPQYRSLDYVVEDVSLTYQGTDPAAYESIFDNAKFDVTDADKTRLIDALYTLSTGERLETAVDIDAMLRYFTVQVFVVNLDSYLGKNGHNYYLYEKDGVISMLPWDYNLAFGTYSLGMPNPINDSTLYINYPIDTPAAGEIMFDRPLYHNLMQYGDSFANYHAYFDRFITEYFESGYFVTEVARVDNLISPYVMQDPTAFCDYADYRQAVKTLTDFCLLRAKSVRRQLSGTIPSTIKGQSEDSSHFIDGSSVWLPDLGEVEDLKNGTR